MDHYTQSRDYAADDTVARWEAPAGLGLFGEEGVQDLVCRESMPRDEVDRLRRLFPEAKIHSK